MKVPDMKKPTETNWERIDALTDDIKDMSDNPPLTDEWFKKAKRRMPKKPAAGAGQDGRAREGTL